MEFQIKPDLQTYPNFILPKRGSAQAAGLDLFAQEDMIFTETTELFNLGFRAAVPEGYVALIVPRSGLGAKFNMQLSNTMGVIDSDYRGDWMAAFHLGGKGTKVDTLPPYGQYQKGFYHQGSELWEKANQNEAPMLLVPKGDAFAQVLFFEVPLMQVTLVDELPETERGEGGFGSTTKSQSA
ncbi:hypothetical protein pEaSNUABM21_00304 [Erwinia phage pEa_SNUABM_21]|nr:hypothetical protein pEaSNUABM21_00304 [Erwinia phage pEa_SNUABM_21]